MPSDQRRIDPRAVASHVPWWVISILVHVCAFLLLGQVRGCLSAPAVPTVADVGIFEGDISPAPPGRRPGQGLPDLGPAMPSVTRPPQTSDVDIDLHRPIPAAAAGGRVDLSDLLARSLPDMSAADVLGPRRGPGGRANALRRFGGSGASERAVDRGLAWLAKHQDRNGRWSRVGYIRHCPRADVCEHRVTAALNVDLDVGVTGLALLAFLGRGYTHTADSPHRDTVKSAIDYLLRMQAASGRFGPPNRYHMYSHGIATLAVSEAAALTGDERLKAVVKSAVTYISGAQQPGGGWDYGFDKTGRNDTSVTGWQVMALKSASLAGVKVPWRTVYGAVRHFDRQTARTTGEVTYADAGDGEGRRTNSMMAVGLLCRLFLGWHRSSPDVIVQAERLLRDLPDWPTMAEGGMHSPYYWYYGTLAMFQMSGRYWDRWNPAMRNMLVRRQTGFGHREGSWEPISRWSKTGGRVYLTALNILDLEIYYRYLPLYRLDGGSLGAAPLATAFRQTADPNERAAIVYDLGQMRDRTADRAVLAALDDPSMAVRFEAGTILARRGRKAGRQVLIEAASHESSFIRSRALEAITALDETWVVPILIERITDSELLLARRANAGLRRITGQQIALSARATSADRAAVQVAWRDWWRARREARPAATGPRRIGTVLAVRAGSNNIVFGTLPGITVEVGQRVWVIRDGQWIAAVRVVETPPHMAAGVVLGAVPGKAPRREDVVTDSPPPSPLSTTRPASTP